MDGRPTWTDCDEAGDYVVPKVLSPRDLVSRKTDETVPHTHLSKHFQVAVVLSSFQQHNSKLLLVDLL